MKVRIHRFAVALSLCLLFGCSAHRTQSVDPPQKPPVDSLPSAVAEEASPAESGMPTIESTPANERADVNEENGGMEALPERTPPAPAALDGAPRLRDYSEVSTFEEDESPIVEEDDAQEGDENGQSLLDRALEFVNRAQEYWAEENQERALAILDDAYSLVLKVDIEANPEFFQQKEDLRYMISKRILEIYASRYTATNGHYGEIPFTLNEYVEREIKLFQGPERKFFEESYRRSGRYMPMILESLKEAGLPEQLAWVPLIESGFKSNALSKARALGLWQFIASTGQKFGLKRDTYIDERLDPEKSTAAAIAYLKELHQLFGDWTTVLAGYNCGEGRVLQKIRSQKINYLDNFWDLFQILPYETARYVPRFLATIHILKDPAAYGFNLGEPDSPIVYETITINKPVQLSAVAEIIGATGDELALLNPELRYKATPPAAYNLKIPQGKADLLLARMDDVPRYSPPRNEYANHTVRKGETLSDIAVRYRTTVARITQANKISEKSIIRIGQKLKVPLTGAGVAVAISSSSSTELLPGSKYKVQKGDSLWNIARKFNTNTKKIQQLNGLKDTRLQIGQILVIPQ